MLSDRSLFRPAISQPQKQALAFLIAAAELFNHALASGNSTGSPTDQPPSPPYEGATSTQIVLVAVALGAFLAVICLTPVLAHKCKR